MTTLVVILIILSFLQTTIIPFNLVIILLIIRAYLGRSKGNLILAFAFGLLASHLMITPWGLQSAVYLMLVVIAQLVSRSPLSQNPLIIVPLVFALISINEAAVSTIISASIAFWPKVVFESLISLPVYLTFKFWEDRFVIK